MATSYSNSGGTGARRHLIRVTGSSAVLNSGMSGPANNTERVYGVVANLVDGGSSNTVWFGNASAVSGTFLRFDFGIGRVIDEITWKQTTTDTHGTWKVQGSNDGSTWTDVGSSFTLGGSTTQAITCTNSTAYYLYQLVGVSGNSNNTPFITQVEFKIDPAPTIDYSYPLSTGNRTSTITVTKAAGLTFTGTLSKLVDGGFVNAEFFGSQTAASKWLKFDLLTGVTKIITEARFMFDGSGGVDHGVWKWQGSNDDITYTDIGSSFTWSSNGTTARGDNETFVMTQLHTNTTAYRYYQIIGVSGNASSNPWLYEFNFALGDSVPGPPPPSGALLINPGMQGGMRPQLFGGMNG